MPEKIEEILRDGFYIWRRNLIIVIPFLLEVIAEMITAGIFFILGILLLLIILSPLLSGSDISEIPYYINRLADVGIFAVLFFLAFVLTFLMVLQAISSFFRAGAIGMAKTATESGKAGISDMLDYGKRKFIDLFFANLIVILINLLGILLFLPLLLSIFFVNENAFILIFFMLGIIGIVVYLIFASIALSPVQYALVASDTGAINGVKEGFRFFMNNKTDVFILWFLILLISIAVSMITGIFQFIAELIPLVGWLFYIIIALLSAAISVLIIAPLSTIWWTMLYIDKNKPVRTSLKGV